MSVPKKLVVLTFDDGVKSHATFVAPLLKKLGFGATFYVTDDERFKGEHYLTWEEAKELNDDGFEIGNHLGLHTNVTRLSAGELAELVEQIEKRCEEYGIDRPVTFCYPGYNNNHNAVKVLAEKGYLFARRGVDPEYPKTDEGDRGPAYIPGQDHPLLVPTTGASGPRWDFDDLVWAVEQAKDGAVAVLTFHGVPDEEHPWVHTDPGDFQRYMEYLKNGGYTVIALRDLKDYVDFSCQPDDPYDPINRRLMLSPVDLRCEDEVDPIGIDRDPPRLSWVLESKKRASRQTAYRILAADSREQLESGNGNRWDSGKVESDRSTAISFGGKALQSGEGCWWKVKVWDEKGESSGYSPAAAFEMGLLKQTDWCARWIGANPEVSSPLLRKEFFLEKPVVKARAYFSGIGWSELYLNGSKVGDSVLDPAPTDYHKSILYVTYDVTSQLTRSENAVGIMLGNGWFCEPGWKHPYSDCPQAILLLHLTYDDGTTDILKSDSTWRATSGPITRNDFYNGEVYNALLEKEGWTNPGYDESDWEPALIKRRLRGILKSQIMPPIRVNRTLKAISETEPKPGVFVFDFGQLFGGWVRIRAKGPAGTAMKIKYSARIDEKTGLLDQKRHQWGDATDTYLMKGNPGREEYEPRFTYHAVRYVQIEGYPGRPTLDDVDGRVIYSDLDLSGGFSCSNPLLNRIHEAVKWTLTNGLFGIPLDCLYREHWAWTDPATITGNLYPRKHMPSFWRKWMEDIRESQYENGGIPSLAPNYRQHTREDAAWGGNYPGLAWYLYQYYDDAGYLEEHYESGKKLLEYLTTLSDHHLVVEGHYGDHMLPGSEPGKEEFISSETPKSLVWTGYYYRAASVLAKMAEILEKPDDPLFFSSLADRIREAFNREWLDEKNFLYASGSQTACFFPLALGIVPDNVREGLVRHIVDEIFNTYHGHLHTGNTGTTCMIDTLVENGHGSVMYDIATTSTYPGWGYMMARGATTIWESWGGNSSEWGPDGGGAESMIMWATIDQFFINDLAGIKGPKFYGPESVLPGYREIVIDPLVLEELSSAGACVKTIRGMISSRWEKNGDSFNIDVQIPPSTTAQIFLPVSGFSLPIIKESRRIVWEDEAYLPGTAGFFGGERVEGKNSVKFKVGSGYYRFSAGESESTAMG